MSAVSSGSPQGAESASPSASRATSSQPTRRAREPHRREPGRLRRQRMASRGALPALSGGPWFGGPGVVELLRRLPAHPPQRNGPPAGHRPPGRPRGSGQAAPAPAAARPGPGSGSAPAPAPAPAPQARRAVRHRRPSRPHRPHRPRRHPPLPRPPRPLPRRPAELRSAGCAAPPPAPSPT